jgi:hypothetical protein
VGERINSLLVKVDPPLIGQWYGLGGVDIVDLLLSSRYVGVSLFPIVRWPVYVNVYRSLVEDISGITNLDTGQIELIAWAGLYRTEEDARRKVVA